MKIELDVPAQRIADMMVGAIEQNHMTRAWCAGVEFHGGKVSINAGSTAWYADPVIFDNPFVIRVLEINDEHEGAEPKVHQVRLAEMRRGLELMATKHGRHFGDMMAENDDNVTQDVFLQCIALGEVIYG